METKQNICLEVKKGEFTFSFNMPVGTTWGSALDASFDVLNYISTMAQQAVERAKPIENHEPEIVEIKE